MRRLKSMGKWSNKWVLKFHPDNCNTLTVGMLASILRAYPYMLRKVQLGHVLEQKYQGITINTNLRRTCVSEDQEGQKHRKKEETLLKTYKAIGKSIINYAAPVWSTNLCDTNYRNIQYTQNEAMRISTGCHKMSSVDHLHAEANMLKVKEHSELLSAQYLARCLEPDNVNFSITTREPPKRMMKETLFTRHRSAVE